MQGWLSNSADTSNKKKASPTKLSASQQRKWRTQFGVKAAAAYAKAGLTYVEALERRNKALTNKLQELREELNHAQIYTGCLKADIRLKYGKPSTAPKSLADVVTMTNAKAAPAKRTQTPKSLADLVQRRC